MPTELEELVEFISHGNTQVRQTAVENLVPFSLSQPEIFKTNGLLPIKDLKLLVRDYEQIAKDAITILINISTDREVLENIASDKDFINILLGRITSPSEPNANLLAMLLANLAKHDSLTSLLTLTRPLPPSSLASSTTAIDQLLDLFVKGADGTYNPAANYDYLSYLFADLAKHPSGRAYFLTPAPQTHDGVVPLCKLTVFTSHASDVRRKGVASTIKNVGFETAAHTAFLAEDEINILPYLLLPLTGNEEYDESEMLDMLPELQLLPADKRRDSDHGVIQTHVETLTLLTTTREGRDRLREIMVYPVIRETHLRVENEDVREACDRLVQVLMRDEEGEEVDHGMTSLSSNSRRIADKPQNGGGAGSWARGQVEEEEEEEKEDEDDDDDDKIVEV